MSQTVKNLMEINSPNIGTMDDIGEYQRLYINNKVGEFLQTHNANIKKHKYIAIKSNKCTNIFEKLEKDFTLYLIHDTRALIISANFMAEIWWSFDSSFTGFSMNLLGSSIENVNNGFDTIKKSLKEFIEDRDKIIYSILQYDSGSIKETKYHDIVDIKFNKQVIPFIDDVDSYVDNFINSDSSILILHGKPGTGKTTFTKYILSKFQEKIEDEKKSCKAMYSFDEGVLYSPEFFHQLIYSEYDIVVLEDFNQIIHKNTDDDSSLNPLHKLLSVTDGILQKKKKIIITTNIESKSQIHPALMRPGRCFDVLNFRNLEGVEIDDLCDSCAKDLDLQIESISASEFYAKCNGEQNSSIVNNKVGF